MDDLCTARFIEVRLLRYVIAVSEELHFGRAAHRLHLSAPTLSKQIKGLELRLGYELFSRKTRDVVTTPAGAAFVDQARHALARVLRAVECGYAASRTDPSVVTLGYSPWVRPSLLLPLQVLFAPAAPQMGLALQSAYSSTQVDLLLRGVLDAGIVELPVAEADLTTFPLWRDELMLALPEGHPLATATEIDHRRLKVEPIISIAATLNPSFSQVFPDFCERLGYSPRVIHEVNTLSEIFDLVRLGLGIGFVKKSAAAVSTENGIAFKALSGSQPYIDTGVAYRNGPLSPSLEKLVELLREHQRWSTQDKRLEETRDV